jgi:glycosyltransferase involved in cell wall biosynthesis
LSDQILHWGFAQTKADYYSLISQANILLVTAIQDFFGIGVVEAIMGGCRPILPLRLAYPEHIHEQFHNQIFYRNVEELAALTREVLWSKQYNDTEAFKNFVQKYRWEYLIPKYDTLFEKTVQ